MPVEVVPADRDPLDPRHVEHQTNQSWGIYNVQRFCGLLLGCLGPGESWGIYDMQRFCGLLLNCLRITICDPVSVIQL